MCYTNALIDHVKFLEKFDEGNQCESTQTAVVSPELFSVCGDLIGLERVQELATRPLSQEQQRVNARREEYSRKLASTIITLECEVCLFKI